MEPKEVIYDKGKSINENCVKTIDRKQQYLQRHRSTAVAATATNNKDNKNQGLINLLFKYCIMQIL